MATERRTFDGKPYLIEAPIDNDRIVQDSELTIKVKNDSTNTYIKEKQISGADVKTILSTFELEVEGAPNPYTLNFEEDLEGNIIPNDVVYKIYEVRQFPTGDVRSLVAQFTVFAFVDRRGFFAWLYNIDKVEENIVSLDFDGKRESVRYTANDDLTFTVTELEREFLPYSNNKIEKTIGISFSGLADDLFDKIGIKEGFADSIESNLSVSEQDTDGIVNIINKEITESERFLKFGVLNETGDSLLVTNWVDGGTLNQVDEEIEPLGSLVLKLYNNAIPLSIKDTVIFSELYSNDIIITADLSEGEEGFDVNRLTPNFQKEVEENTISTFSDYQSFNELTLSGSSLQERIVDYFLQRKQESVGLNTDFTDFNNFVKFSSAEERLVNFRYKVTELERLTIASSSLSASNATASLSSSFVSTRIEDINDEIRSIKNGFDEYESFLFDDSGSLYENQPYVSSSDNVYASWPKNTPTEQINNGDFDTVVSWSVDGSNTTISNNYARIYRDGEVSQSLSLTPNREYTLKFDVESNGLPVSFEYNGKVVVNETIFASGSNQFNFKTTNLQNSDDVFTIKGADYGDGTKFTDIDNLSVKQTPQLLASTDSEVISWFSNFREIAKDYDRRNKDSLKNNTPEYIRTDSQNDDYVLFLDMIGQMFDEIWLYGNELGNLYDWDNSIKEGLSEDLSIVLLEAYGNNLDIGFSEKDVWEYILGVDRNEDELGREIGFSFERRQKETIRRLLTNLPYFLKHKGTARSIRGLILSYGIPLSTLFIREYGTFQGTEGLETIFTKETVTIKLDLSGGSKSINTTGSFLTSSNAIEFNVQFNGTSASEIISGSDTVNGGGFTISTTTIGSSSGSFVLSIESGSDSYELSSSVAPIYNGEFWNVLAQQTDSGSYEIRAYQFNRDDGTYEYEIFNTGSVSTGISASIDDSFITNDKIELSSFNGFLDEWRVWDTSLSDSVFREHVKFPTSVKLSDPLQIPNSLLLRADVEFGSYTVYTDGKIPNLVFNPTYPTQLTASNFEVGDFVSYTRTDYINSTNVGNEKLGNNKIRYEVTQSLNGGVLTPNFEGTDRNNETVSNVDDSYKLTIGFSPTDITNEIILQHFGGNDLLDEFGDPRDVYDTRYPDLERTVEEFFRNISSNKKSQFYIEYIRNFDKTLFENIEKFVPERSDLSTSIFIEPHYLNRSKAKRLGQSETEDLFREGNEVEEPYTVSSTSNTDQNTDNPLVTTDEETLVAEVFSEMNTNNAVAVISEDEVSQYLNQSTDVIILQDGFESQVLRNNVWEEDSSITVSNKYGETFRFKVYKFDYSTRLADLESEIGNYITSNDLDYTDSETGFKKYEIDRGYQDLTRLWDTYYNLHNSLFLLDYDANPIDDSVLVTYEDLPKSLKEDLVFSSSTTQVNKTINQNGITYTISDDTADGGAVVETTRTSDTKTIVDDPDGDVKLTVE